MAESVVRLDMTRKLDYTISETITTQSKNRIQVPKKYASYIGLNKGFVAHVTNLNGSYVISVCPTPESKKYMVDKDGAVRFQVEKSEYKIMIADSVVVIL
jgi:DNA-binding transcriptional regulator/RsmH inhibitor MraZ